MTKFDRRIYTIYISVYVRVYRAHIAKLHVLGYVAVGKCVNKHIYTYTLGLESMPFSEDFFKNIYFIFRIL